MASDMEKEKDDEEENVNEESEELDSDSEGKEEETNDGEKKQYTFAKGFDIVCSWFFSSIFCLFY